MSQYITASKNQAIKQHAESFSPRVIGKVGRSPDLSETINASRILTSSDPNRSQRDFCYGNSPLKVAPKNFAEIVFACRYAYLRYGIIRNVVDSLTDFVLEDMKIIHPNPSAQKFLTIWKDKVDMQNVVSEFARHFLIDHNVVIKRHTAKITRAAQKDWVDKVVASDMNGIDTITKQSEWFRRREIPTRYEFLNIALLDWVVDGNGKKRLAYNVTPSQLRTIKQGINRGTIVNMSQPGLQAPQYLDEKRTIVYHNKKDSWDDWSVPFLYSILTELFYKDKLREADISALNATINVIRLWKLGDHTQGIFPDGSIDTLDEILAGMSENGSAPIDIIWDSMIDMEAYYPPLDKILGPEKYTQVDKDILTGLGVPEILLGGQGGKFSNSYIQLKSVIERLKYVQKAIKSFLYNELKIICKTMGFAKMPLVRFGQMNLDNEEMNRRLVLNLLDRNIVSVESVLDAYGYDFFIETERIKREEKKLEKAGIVRTSAVPIPTNPEEEGEEPSNNKNDDDNNNRRQTSPERKQTNRQGGRPQGRSDTRPRKRRNFNIRTTAELAVHADDILAEIDNDIVPGWLQDHQIESLRKITKEQKQELEIAKLAVFSASTPNGLAETEDTFEPELFAELQNCKKNWVKTHEKEPTQNQLRQLYIQTWAKYFSGE